MFIDDRKKALPRVLLGGLLGVAGYLLLSFVTQPGAFLGGSFTLDFTFCFNARVPEALGAALGAAGWYFGYRKLASEPEDRGGEAKAESRAPAA